jgi:hypothetical protein
VDVRDERIGMESGKHAVEKVFAARRRLRQVARARSTRSILWFRAMNVQAWADAPNADLLFAAFTTAAISVAVKRVEELDEADIRGVGRIHAVRAG